MAHHQQARMYASAEENEPVLLFRMVWVSYKTCELICKDSFGLLERDVMLLAISGILTRIPAKRIMAHRYLVVTL